MGNYFVLRARPSPPSVAGYMEIEDSIDLPGFKGWRSGVPARRTPEGAVVIAALPRDGYAGAPNDFSDMSVPLVSARFKQALVSAGVDNVTYYPVQLRNSATGQDYEFFAFNLIGLLSVADFAASQIDSADGSFVGDSEVSALVIDETRCRGLKMFRMKEKFSTILVHKDVKDAVESAGIDTVTFLNPEDYMAL